MNKKKITLTEPYGGYGVIRCTISWGRVDPRRLATLPSQDDGMVRRRGFIATTVGILAAGCSQPIRGDPDSPTPTTDGGSTPEDGSTSPSPTSERSLAVRSATVQSAVIYRTSPDSAAVRPPERAQFLLLDVSATAPDPPDLDAFSLRIDSGPFAPRAVSKSGRSVHVDGEVAAPYTKGQGDGWIAFDLPRVDAEEATLRLQDDDGTLREEVPRETVGALASAADFEVRDASYRDCTLSVDVRNTGDADGTFRAAFNGSGTGYFFKPVRFAVAAGDRRSWEHCYDLDVSDYELVWSDGRERFSGE